MMVPSATCLPPDRTRTVASSIDFETGSKMEMKSGETRLKLGFFADFFFCLVSFLALGSSSFSSSESFAFSLVALDFFALGSAVAV